MSEKVRLVDTHGATSVRIDVEITDEGDLLFSGQDVGDAPNEFWGDIVLAQRKPARTSPAKPL
jgi:hypothetical protein